jgi:hypothetical protein
MAPPIRPWTSEDRQTAPLSVKACRPTALMRIIAAVALRVVDRHIIDTGPDRCFCPSAIPLDCSPALHLPAGGGLLLLVWLVPHVPTSVSGECGVSSAGPAWRSTAGRVSVGTQSAPMGWPRRRPYHPASGKSIASGAGSRSFASVAAGQLLGQPRTKQCGLRWMKSWSSPHVGRSMCAGRLLVLHCACS